MMHAHASTLILAIVAALSLGWTPLLALAQPTPAAAACDRCGKVESIREVANKDQWTPLGSSVPRSSDLGPTGVAVSNGKFVRRWSGSGGPGSRSREF